MFEVNFWCSFPGQNDDCSTGVQFDTLEEAKEFLKSPFEHRLLFSGFKSKAFKESIQFFQLVGPDVEIIKENSFYKPAPIYNEDEEYFRQIGMESGCDGYNDSRGY